MDTETAMAHLAETMARREERWRWENIDPVVRAEFASRMEPGADPEPEWSSRSVRVRRELDWHLRLRPGQYRSVFEEDSHRLQMEADQASVEAFRILTEIASGARAS
jgi:hypothetical protein